jgi:MerR family transcriptional regulator, light-induced transcriptional regulator
MDISSRLSLTPSQLAQQTGIPAGTLRVWTARYGFPAGDRGPGGHHRYSVQDVEAVLAVRRLRDQGMSLAAAIGRVSVARPASEASIYAALRRRRPDLQPLVLRKAGLLALSRAIEDEHCARAGSGLLLASFQRERHYRASERRWRELSRTVRHAVALADFAAVREPKGAPIEVPLPPGHQLRREWTLITDSPEACACLAAWELAADRPTADAARRFEVIWSFDPDTVGDARSVAHSILGDLAPPVAARIPAGPEQSRSAAEGSSFGAALSNRAFAYLADAVEPDPRAARRRTPKR